MTASTDCLRCFITVYLESNLSLTCNGKVSKIVHLYRKCCIRESLMVVLVPAAKKMAPSSSIDQDVLNIEIL